MDLEVAHQVPEGGEVDLQPGLLGAGEQVGGVGHHVDLPPLQAVKGVIGVLVVLPEDQVENLLRWDAGGLADPPDGLERRRDHHAAEVEHHGLDHRRGTLPMPQSGP